MRTSRKKLRGYVERINAATGRTYELDVMPSGYRLVGSYGTRDVSERVSAGMMRQYLLGMIEGFIGPT